MDRSITIHKIKNIIDTELNILIQLLEKDFIKNYTRKKHNFTVASLGPDLISSLVFVSSFESKAGIVLERIIRKIAILKFGSNKVPKFIISNTLDQNEKQFFIEQNKTESAAREQFIVTKLNINDSDIKGKIAEFISKHSANGRGKNRIPSSLSTKTLSDIFDYVSPTQSEEIIRKPIDLCIIEDDGSQKLFEIKLSGDLDSSNAPGNVNKMMAIFLGLSNLKSHIYFATAYNKNGEGNNWTGAIKKYLNDDLIKIGSKFWELILPKNLSFDEFKEIYFNSTRELKIQNRLKILLTQIQVQN